MFTFTSKRFKSCVTTSLPLWGIHPITGTGPVLRVPVQDWVKERNPRLTAYLDVGAEFGVNLVGCHHVRQQGGAREGGGDGVAHFGEGEHLEAELLVHLPQLFVGLLFSLTQDAAHGIPTLPWRPLRGDTERARVHLGSTKAIQT